MRERQVRSIVKRKVNARQSKQKKDWDKSTRESVEQNLIVDDEESIQDLGEQIASVFTLIYS